MYADGVSDAWYWYGEYGIGVQYIGECDIHAGGTIANGGHGNTVHDGMVVTSNCGAVRFPN